MNNEIINEKSELLEYGDFKVDVVDRLNRKLIEEGIEDEFTVVVSETVKLNDQRLDSIYLARESQEMCPTYYLNYMYDAYRKGVGIDELVDSLLDMCLEGNMPCGMNPEFFENFDNVSDKIFCRLINAKSNRNMLEKAPCVNFLDLAVVFYVMLEDGDNGTYQAMVNDALLEMWGKTKDEILKLACKNTRLKNPPVFMSMREMLEDTPALKLDTFADEDNLPKMFSVSGKTGRNGAIYMLDMKNMERAAMEFNDDVAIIPSSIHEVLLVPASTVERFSIDETIREVNASCLERGDYLSDHAYLYSRESGIITA